jgi:hypothetical protein
MTIVALVVWCATACFGVYLLGLWLSRGVCTSRRPELPFSRRAHFAHPVLATAGLSLWIAYLLTGRLVFAWCGPWC